MTLEAALGLALASFIFSLIPGPGVMAVTAQSLSRGFSHGLRFTAGLALGDMIYLCMAMCGMGWAASCLGEFFVVLKWAGAAYLVWLGVKCLFAAPPDPALDPQARRKSAPFIAGLCVTLGNPKVIAFYCGFLPGFIDMSRLDAWGALGVVSIIMPIIFITPLGYAWLAARGRKLARSSRLWRTANVSAGCVMIGAGVAVAAE